MFNYSAFSILINFNKFIIACFGRNNPVLQKTNCIPVSTRSIGTHCYVNC